MVNFYTAFYTPKATRLIAKWARPKSVVNYANSLATWGVMAGAAALFFLEPTPIARTDIFVKIPVVGGWWQKKLDAAAQKD
ncbi:hypothetical protein HDV00_011063 [Rhizophlyctis rosea]|nr:hypothetical protein HDV00_011063 [Rhizophlyctis rosea]